MPPRSGRCMKLRTRCAQRVNMTFLSGPEKERHDTAIGWTTPYGGPAIPEGPVALRPTLADGLPWSWNPMVAAGIGQRRGTSPPYQTLNNNLGVVKSPHPV